MRMDFKWFRFCYFNSGRVNVLTHDAFAYRSASLKDIPHGRISGYGHCFQHLDIMNSMVRNYLGFLMFFQKLFFFKSKEYQISS